MAAEPAAPVPGFCLLATVPPQKPIVTAFGGATPARDCFSSPARKSKQSFHNKLHHLELEKKLFWMFVIVKTNQLFIRRVCSSDLNSSKLWASTGTTSAVFFQLLEISWTSFLGQDSTVKICCKWSKMKDFYLFVVLGLFLFLFLLLSPP